MQKTDRISIKDAVKPVNPVISEPIPIPQTDQSHPIPPEIIIDSNIQLPIHNKHIHHKHLQNQLQLPIIKPPKIKDSEGLGSKIPIGSIESIASSIGAAALTGGAAAAVEVLLMDGTAGLINAGRTIIGASIGSFVAAGASSALGHSDIANVTSSIIGGIAGRSVGQILQKRRIRHQNEINEQTPLLQAGNRLRGQEGPSRSITQEPTNTQQPAPAPVSRNPFTILKQKQKDTTNKIKNMKQLITKPYTPLEINAAARGPGTSTTDYNKQQFPSVPQLHEPIQREPITTHEHLQYRYLQQEHKQLQRKHLEDIKGGIQILIYYNYAILQNLVHIGNQTLY